ncbi:MAG: hypothetical protein KatS3mg126_0280 [Lysobacteraceae bacterium]|nr:MAG: hypothetical protein KatS3mg126_0280 [Xanthomonadaceae bacterium]
MQIIVLGMHRSGTSVVARAINLMGASVGTAESIGGPAFDNPKGFWERSEARYLNDALLADVGCRWDSPFGFEPQAVSSTARSDFECAARKLIFALDTHRPWVLKDPRISLTLPFWRPLLEAPVCVLPLRHPLEIAQSLRMRNGFAPELSVALTDCYLRSALANAAGLDVVIVDYASFVEAPFDGMKGLHARLTEAGATGLRLPSQREIGAFVDKDLKHHRADRLSADERFDSTIALYRALIEKGFPSCSPPAPSPDWVGEELARRRTYLADLVAAERQALEQRREEIRIDAMDEFRARLDSVSSGLKGLQEGVLRNLVEGFEDIRTDSARQEERVDALVQALGQQDSVMQSLTVDLEQVSARLAAQLGRHEQLQAEVLRESGRIDALDAKLEASGKQLRSELLEIREKLQHAIESAQYGIKTALTEIAALKENQRRHDETARERINQLASENAALAADRNELAHALRLCEEDVQQLRRWLEDALSLSEASFSSARWRLGDGVIRVIEAVLRRRPRLARDGVADIGRFYAEWRKRRMTVRESAASRRAGQPTLAVVPSSSPASIALPSQPPFPERRHDRCDVIVFPVIDWHFRIQRPQHLARELALAGHRVFYLYTRPEAGAEVDGFEWVETPEPGVYLVRLRSSNARVPNLYTERLAGADLDHLRSALYALADHAGIVAPVAIVDLPFWRPLAEALPSTLMVYDCMDYHAGFSTNSSEMLDQEAALVDAADLVVTTSSWLHDEVGKRRPNRLIPNAAEVQRFREAGMRPRQRDGRVLVGYIGAIAEWFDLDLVIAAARALPEFDFELVGAVTDIDPSPAEELPNLRFLGEVPYSEAADHVARFDVCIIPFQLTTLTQATNPVKVYEYLAAGRPVVATPLPELRACLPLVRLAAGPEDFVSALREAAAERNDTALVEQRMRWASGHDWAARASSLRSALLELQPKVSVIVLCWNNRCFTEACLTSLERHTDYPDWELILVDNASEDGTPELLHQFAAGRPNVKLVLNESNLGFAAGNNAGIRQATGEIVILLNNDTYVTPGWMQGLVGHLLRNPSLGAVGPVTNNIGNEARVEIHYGDMEQMVREAARLTRGKSRQLLPIGVLAFFCVAIRRQAIEAIGLLDEGFGQGFFEDDDYCRRLEQAGFDIAVAEDVFVHHHLSGSFSTIDQDKRKELFERNKAYYESKWGEWKPHRYRD